MAIIDVSDLPVALQSADLIGLMVDGANARAARVAPCLLSPTSTAWAASTAYVVADRVVLPGGEYLEATVAGTSGATAPTAPAAVAGTVVDGTVTWKRISPTPDQLAEARLVLVGAVKRWAETGAGALAAQTAGPFGQTIDTRQRTGFNLWPSEISGLQDICKTGSSGAFSVDTVGVGTSHLPWCALMFGAAYCSCGADLTNYQYPLYEGGVLSVDEF